jgi:multisubunit Na+/H+ antiporter MnhC subunit
MLWGAYLYSERHSYGFVIGMAMATVAIYGFIWCAVGSFKGYRRAVREHNRAMKGMQD